MDYDYIGIIASYRQKYARLAEEATPNSPKWYACDQIVQYIDREKSDPPSQRAFTEPDEPLTNEPLTSSIRFSRSTSNHQAMRS